MNILKKLFNRDSIEKIFDMPMIERIFKVRIVRPRKVALLFEEIHLRKFFEYFKVDCVFDVGANEGQYAMMLRRIGYMGTIISFEPVPRAVGILRKGAESDPKWHIEPIALDSVTRKATFHVMAVDQFSSLNAPSEKEVGPLFKNSNKVAEELSVETATLKDMLTKYRALLDFKRPFLKMDTQGSDLAIARGSADVLGAFVGLQSELSIKKIYEDTSDYTAVINYYRSQGFELSAFVPNNAGSFPYLVEIDCIMFNDQILKDMKKEFIGSTFTKGTAASKK